MINKGEQMSNDGSVLWEILLWEENSRNEWERYISLLFRVQKVLRKKWNFATWFRGGYKKMYSSTWWIAVVYDRNVYPWSIL